MKTLSPPQPAASMVPAIPPRVRAKFNAQCKVLRKTAVGDALLDMAARNDRWRGTMEELGLALRYEFCPDRRIKELPLQSVIRGLIEQLLPRLNKVGIAWTIGIDHQWSMNGCDFQSRIGVVPPPKRSARSKHAYPSKPGPHRVEKIFAPKISVNSDRRRKD